MKLLLVKGLLPLLLVLKLFGGNNSPDISLSFLVEQCPSAGPDQNICIGDCVTIGCELDSGSEDYCYTWFIPSDVIGEGELYAGNMIEVCPRITTTYTLYVTDDNGNLINEDNVTVTVHDLPNVRVTPPSSIICDGETVTLMATPGFSSYLWSNGGTTNSITVGSADDYSVIVSNDAGCTTSVTVKVVEQDASIEELTEVLEAAGFAKIAVEILDLPPGPPGVTGNITTTCSAGIPNVENLAGEVIIAEGESSYCLSDEVVEDIVTSIGLGDNVGGIIQNEFCEGGYNFEEFLSFGEGQYEAVMQVFVYDSATEDFLFINTTNYELFAPEIVPDIIYPPNINALGDLSSGCNYRIENIDGVCWGFKQESGGEWLQDTKMEVVKNAAFGETYDSGDLDNTCCDGEESIDIDSYPWYTTISKNRRTRGLMFSFNRGLVESVAFLGCWGCSEYAAKIRDDFYTGDIRTLE